MTNSAAIFVFMIIFPRTEREIRREEHLKWLASLHDLKQMKNCRLPRCISMPNALLNKIQLDVFFDASLSGFLPVTYRWTVAVTYIF